MINNELNLNINIVADEEFCVDRVVNGNFLTPDLLHRIELLTRKLKDDNFILEAKRIFYTYDEDLSEEIDLDEFHKIVHNLGFYWISKKNKENTVLHLRSLKK